MSEQGAALQTYNHELVKCKESICKVISIALIQIFPDIEHLKKQRIKLNETIIRDEEMRAKLIQEVSSLESRLHELDSNIEEKIRRRDECDKILEESETGLQKIIESSKLLLNLVQKETTANNKYDT